MLRSLTLWALALALVACAPQKIEPTKLPVTALDEEQATFPPSEDELLHRARTYVNLVTFKDPTVTPQREEEILRFIEESFGKYADFSPVPPSRVEALLSMSEYRGFRPESAAQIINLGQSLGAQFAMQTQLSIAESKLEKGVDRFKAQVGLTVFKVDSGQAVFKETFIYRSEEPAESRQAARQIIERHFPLKGFVLQTRGERQVAKISLGSSLGLEAGRKVQIRSRQVKRDLVGGVNTGLITYSAPLTTAEVIQVQPNDAWIKLDPRDKDKIKKGDVVFTLPSKRRSLF